MQSFTADLLLYMFGNGKFDSGSVFSDKINQRIGFTWLQYLEAM